MILRHVLPQSRPRAAIHLIAVVLAAIATGSTHLLAQPASVVQGQPDDKSTMPSESREDSDNDVLLNGLRERYRKKQKEVQEKSDAIQMLAEQLGTLNNKTIASEQRLRLQELQTTKRELDLLRKSLNDAIGELTTGTASEHLIQDELEKDAEFLSLRYQNSQLEDQLEAQSKTVRPGSSVLNQLQQEIRFLKRKQAALREALTPKVVERLKSTRGESDLDRQKAWLMQRATVQQLTNQMQAVEKTYYRHLAEYLELGGSSRELLVRMAELEGLRRELDLIRVQMKALEMEDEQAAPSDVRTFVQQMKMLLEELEKAVSEHHDPPTK